MVPFVATLGCWLSATGCPPSPDCAIADEVIELKPRGNKAMEGPYIFLRTSGFADKIQVVEMYATRPGFDTCGDTSVAPISEAVVDEAQGAPKRVRVHTASVAIVYERPDPDFNTRDIEIVLDPHR